MRVAVLGCGLQANTIVSDLLKQPDVEAVIIADRSRSLAEKLAEQFPGKRLILRTFEATSLASICSVIKDVDACVSAVPYRFNLTIAQACIEVGTHMCDLGGNNAIVRQQLELDEAAREARVTILPDCGLAPGLVSIIAADAINYFDQTATVALRVGGIPAEPTGSALNYFPTFSSDGLINEYREPVTVIHNGEVKTIDPLTQRQTISIKGLTYEAFATSGGVSTLPQTYQGQVEFLDYKTIRYPGHMQVIKGLMELGFLDDDNGTSLGAPLSSILKHRINCLDKGQDKIVLHCWAAGRKNGDIQIRKVTHVEMGDSQFSAMAKMTGYPASISLLMLARGLLPPGAQPQETVIDPGLFFHDLRKRDINLEITTEKARHP
jgi:lysine 6-dehydrogenase